MKILVKAASGSLVSLIFKVLKEIKHSENILGHNRNLKKEKYMVLNSKVDYSTREYFETDLIGFEIFQTYLRIDSISSIYAGDQSGKWKNLECEDSFYMYPKKPFSKSKFSTFTDIYDSCRIGLSPFLQTG